MIVSGNTAIDIGSCEAFRYAYAFSQNATNSNPMTTGFKPDGLGAFVASQLRCVSDVAGYWREHVGRAEDTFTTILQFAPEAWLLGIVRSLRIEVLRERYAEYDQDAVKITWRGDLKPMLARQSHGCHGRRRGLYHSPTRAGHDGPPSPPKAIRN